MVRPENLGVNLRPGETLAQAVGDDEIVDAPAGVLLAGLEAVGPPGIDVCLVRVEVTERVGETCVEQLLELGTLLVGEACVLAVALRVLQVDFLMGDVHVAADDDGLAGVEPQEIVAEGVLPRHAVVQATEAVLRIGRVDGHEEEVVHLQRDDAPLTVVLLDVESVGHAERFAAREDGRARIAFLLGIVPVGLVSVKREVELSLLHLGFLKAEKIGIECLKGLAETFVATGAKPVDIP